MKRLIYPTYFLATGLQLLHLILDALPNETN
jgi:hypothetical protein